MVFDIDGEKWTLDLRPGQRKVTQGAPEGKPDLTLTISDDNFVKLVSGKMGPQQARARSNPSCALVRGTFDLGWGKMGCRRAQATTLPGAGQCRSSALYRSSFHYSTACSHAWY